MNIKSTSSTTREDRRIITIAFVGSLLVVSFFAVERIAGVERDVRGQGIYGATQMPQEYSAPKTTNSQRSSARSVLRRTGRSDQAISTKTVSRTRPRPSSSSQSFCSNAECSSLYYRFLEGDPACMKHTSCSAYLRLTTSRSSCTSESCKIARSLFEYFSASPDCITGMTPICEYDVNRRILLKGNI